MSNEQDISRLEQFVEKLLAGYNELKGRNAEMIELLARRDEEIQELRDQIDGLQDDRTIMHDRVSTLIDRIDDWEKVFEQAGTETVAVVKPTASATGNQEKSPLFSVGMTGGQEPARG